MPAADSERDLLVLEWFPDATERAVFPGGDGGVEGGVGRYHHDNRVGIHLQKLFERAQTADAGHGNVEQDHVVSAAAIRLESFFAGLGEIHPIAFGREQGLEDLAHDLFVVDD